MTTIAWDGFNLVTDSIVTNGDHVFGKIKKIHKIKNGSWFAAAGPVDFVYAVIEWLNGGEKPIKNENENFIGILISTDEDGYAISHEISNQLRMWPACIPWAAGTGESFALTAMRCGKGAVEAVRIACEMDVYSGGEIQIMSDFDTR